MNYLRNRSSAKSFSFILKLATQEDLENIKKYIEQREEILKENEKMSNNNYFTITYKILSYLKECYEKSEDVDPNILSAGTLNISEKQFVTTLNMILSEGYIDGVRVQETLDGYNILNNSNKASITPKGLEYLEENSMMKKERGVLKNVKDWLPIIK